MKKVSSGGSVIGEEFMDVVVRRISGASWVSEGVPFD